MSNNALDDNAFEALDEELFATASGANASSPTAASVSASPANVAPEADRDGRFLAELASISKFCGRNPTTRETPRMHALVHLTRFAHTRSHLDDLASVVAGWREARHSIDAHMSREIVGRCINLRHPEVALFILANRPKYGIDLPSLHVARVLLQSLCKRAREDAPPVAVDAESSPPVTSSRVNDVFLLAALYPHYKLPEVYDDPVSLAMVLGFCTSSTDDAARQIGADLMDAARSRRTISTPVKIELSDREKEWVREGRSSIPYPVVWA